MPVWEPAPPTYRIVTESHTGSAYNNKNEKTTVDLNVGDMGVVIAEHEVARKKIIMNFTRLPGLNVYVERDKSSELTEAHAQAAAEAEALRGKSFLVKRSSGIVEPGWSLVGNGNITFDTASGKFEVTSSNGKWIKKVLISDLKMYNPELFIATEVRALKAAAKAKAAAEAKAAAADYDADDSDSDSETSSAETVAAPSHSVKKQNILSMYFSHNGGKRRQIKITKKNKRSHGARYCTHRSRSISCRRGKTALRRRNRSLLPFKNKSKVKNQSQKSK